jgi:hypothetical protein
MMNATESNDDGRQGQGQTPEEIATTAVGSAESFEGESPQDLRRTAEELRQRIHRWADEVTHDMAPYDAFDVVVNVSFSNMPLDPDAYKESQHSGLLAIVEYAALLLPTACHKGRDRGSRANRVGIIC